MTAQEVLARMRRGDLPHLAGGYSMKSVFDDGAKVPHAVMYRLFKKGRIEYPKGTSLSATWILNTKDRA